MKTKELTLEEVGAMFGRKVQIVTDVTEHIKSEKAYERRMRCECRGGGIGDYSESSPGSIGG